MKRNRIDFSSVHTFDLEHTRLVVGLKNESWTLNFVFSFMRCVYGCFGKSIQCHIKTESKIILKEIVWILKLKDFHVVCLFLFHG
jgi:hypothetical protein